MFKQKLNSIIALLMPLCLISSGFVNMILYYFGLHAFDNIRRMLSIFILSIFFCLSLFKLLFLYQDHPRYRKKIIELCYIPALWIISFFYAMLKFGIQTEIFFNLITFGIYCIPAFIIAISIAIERTEREFIENIKWYALIITPLMIYYNIRMCITPAFVYKLNDLGALNYLCIGYTLVPIMIFCVFSLFLNKEKDQWLNIFLIVLIWISCINTGAKGALVCLLVFLFLFTGYLLIMRQKDKTIFCLFPLLTFILLFMFLIYSPPSSGLYRTNMLMKDFKNLTIQSTQMAEQDKNLISKLADNASPTKNIRQVFQETVETSDNIQDEGKKEEPGALFGTKWDRIFLYKMAIKEGNEALFGLGPMGYTLKYGTYPHNIILELIADFGYLVTALFILVICILMVFLYKKAKKNRIVACMLVYLVSCIPGQSLNGTMYTSVILLFALGYACASNNFINKL